MKLSVIVPIFNEGATIESAMKNLLAQNLGDWEKEVGVVDEGTTDETPAILKTFGDRVKVISHQTNQGKGAAVRTAIKHLTGEAVIIQDADSEYDPADIPKLLEAFKTS